MGPARPVINRSYSPGKPLLYKTLEVVLLVHFKLYFSNIDIQEIPETQLSTSASPSNSKDKDSIIKNIHEIVRSTSATKRKRNIEPQNLIRKKPKKTAAEPAIIDEVNLLVTQLKTIEQDLETEKKKVRTLEKKLIRWRKEKKRN